MNTIQQYNNIHKHICILLYACVHINIRTDGKFEISNLHFRLPNTGIPPHRIRPQNFPKATHSLITRVALFK